MYKKYYIFLLVAASLLLEGCNYFSHRTYVKPEISEDEDPEPEYNISLGENYQDFVEFAFMGNRSENFGTYFNKFFTAEEDYDIAMTEYNASFIANYNPKLDSLNILPPVQQSIKDKFTKVIERCSKIIQYNKNTRYIDDAVLLIGKSYYYMQDYLQAERKFGEFLSKLTSSPLYDQAILYLARTKMKLGNTSESEAIFRNLLEKTTDNEIKSEIYEELAISSLSKTAYKDAITLFEQSIEQTKNKENKAKKQFIIGKIYMKLNPENSVKMYDNVIKNTSNFDMEYYALFNKSIALNRLEKSAEALVLLKDMEKEYRDYPEFVQLAAGEHAHSLFILKKYDEAILKCFNVIFLYSSSKVAADCYYYIASYYENVKQDYLNAATNYKKAKNSSTSSEYYTVSEAKFNMIDKYFTYLADISDTVKVNIPDENPEYEKFYFEKMKEKDESVPVKGNENFENKGKTGGIKDSNEVIQKDSSGHEKTLDSLKNIKSKDSSEVTQPEMPKINQDSILQVKFDKKMTAYFSMAELFIYNFNILDSAIYYLEYVVVNDNDKLRKPKAMYMLSGLYKSKGLNEKADSLLNAVIINYPETEIANESRKLLGIPVIEIAKDEADAEYILAMQKAVAGNYTEALNILKSIPVKFPQSPLAPKAVYTTAYIFENYYLNKDSANIYYKLLKEKHPGSVYAQNIDEKIQLYDPAPKIQDTKIDSTILSDTNKIVTLDSNPINNVISQDSIPAPEPELRKDSSDTKEFKKE